MSKIKTIGMIGLDTSHVNAFARIFNDAGYEHHVAGAKVTHGFAGGSPDMETSISRVAGFTEKLQKDFGVTIVDSPEEVAKNVDIVFITAVDGRTHRGYFEKVAPFGKPTFIDKPFAATLADAQAIVKLAKEKKIPLTTCSSLRFSDRLEETLAKAGADDKALSASVHGPMALNPQLPGLLWYGVHAVEMLIRVMGPNCVSVQTTTTEDQDIVVGKWADGRLASYHGLRNNHSRFGMTIHRKSGVQNVDASDMTAPWYASMMKQVVPALIEGKTAVPVEDSLAVMAFMEAANTSRDNNGKLVEIKPVSA